ncbi:MAG: hypothetical protein V3V00_02985, partial [Saprospiraceae bacterium]
MPIDQVLLNNYCQNNSSQNNAYLAEIERNIALLSADPSLSSDFAQGRILSLISKLLKPSYILEIGTFLGYATICLSEGLCEGGIIHSLEKNEDYKEQITHHISLAKASKKVKIFYGSALDTLAHLDLNLYD